MQGPTEDLDPTAETTGVESTGAEGTGFESSADMAADATDASTSDASTTDSSTTDASTYAAPKKKRVVRKKKSDDPEKPAEPKTLKRGVDALRVVERPHEVQGVSTQAIGDASGKGKAGEKSKLEGTEDFDPATDLPMFREGMNWFVLRVASNKERSVRQTLLRKVRIEGMESFVGRIMVPTEKTKTLKGNKPKVTETMLYPGYVFVEMRLEPDGRIPQDVFFLIKETDGVGDFVGTAGRPTPMAQHEVEKMLFDSRKPEEADGPFQSYEGEIDEVLPEKGLVRVLVTIFGRQAPIELEYWQVRKGIESQD
jgi:transcriptional antiterminator NusG